ncbi:MAG: PilN domain-containing protein [Gemmatimonadota bacterium]
MIEVNLLPGGKKRGPRGSGLSFKLPSVEAAPRDPWVLGSALVVLLAVAVSAYLYLTTSGTHGELTVSLEEAVSDSARYADLIEQNDALLARRDSIAQRVSIIQEIDGDRYTWPHIMDEVARALPDYTWLEQVLQISAGDPLSIRISGRAGNNFAVTQFMENLEASLFLRNVELIRTEQVVETIGGVSRIVNQFELNVEYERPPVELLETVPLFDAGPDGP